MTTGVLALMTFVASFAAGAEIYIAQRAWFRGDLLSAILDSALAILCLVAANWWAREWSNELIARSGECRDSHP